MNKILKSTLKTLNVDQIKAVENTEGPMLVIAGPGSGKTRVLTAKIANIIEKDCANSDEILAVTFTNKAAEEIKERLRTYFGKDFNPIWVSTFHSASLKLLKIYHKESNLPRNFSITDPEGSKKILKSLNDNLSNEEVEVIAKGISKLKNEGFYKIEEEDIKKDREILKYFFAYNEKMREIATLDFDDILLNLLILLESNSKVRETIRRKFKYILVDEFQDTNLVQSKILELISSKDGNITVVGDRDQSIYGFRGSRPELIDKFLKNFKKVKIVYLNENYRSTPKIVEVSSEIIKKNPSELRNTLKTKNKDLGEVKILKCYNEKTEGEAIAERVKKLNGSTAILMRINSQSREIEEKLTDKKINYKMIGSVRFYDRLEIKDIMSYLKLAYNPRDEISFQRAINVPRRGLGKVALEKVMKLAKNNYENDIIEGINHLVESEMSPGKQRDGFINFSFYISQVKEAMRSSPSEAIRFLLNELDLEKIYNLELDKNEGRVENLKQLLRSAENFENEHVDNNYKDFELSNMWLEHTSLYTSTDYEDKNSEASVMIMTVHASKGREFDNVFVVGVDENLFPFKRYNEETNLEEERRLFFVACSRSKLNLYISHTNFKTQYGRRSEQNKSIFIKELENFVDVVEVKGNKERDDYRENLRNAQGNKFDPIHKIQNERLDADKVVVGIKVTHPIFGNGIVKELRDRKYISIEFKDKSVRVFLIEKAPLKLI